MREHVVQPGDSPASIAAAYAGCPKCAKDLVALHSHRPTISYPNGYKTFREMSAGERLALPDKWFNGSLDALPSSYFAALPHPNGTTHGVGTLGDPASDAVSALAQLDDHAFSYAVPPACLLLDQSVAAADGSADPRIKAYASATHIGTSAAKARNQDLIKAMSAGDQATASAARLAIQNDLLTAVASAELAIQTAPASGSVLVDIGQATIDPSIMTAAARAAAAAIAADPNFCTNVAQAGSAVNTAVHSFKTAWNAANPSNPVPINTGTYDQATATVLTQILGNAPPACGTRAAPAPSPIPLPGITPPQNLAQTQTKGVSVGAVVGIGLLGAGAVGGGWYLVTHRRPRVRRVRSSFGAFS
jgi:hypothetical protein